jgi:hypothetical protein
MKLISMLRRSLDTGLVLFSTNMQSKLVWLVLALLFTNDLTSSATNCDPPPSGIVSWWLGEGNATDVITGSNGVMYTGVSFTSGIVGQCFSFNGAAGCVINGLPLTNIQNSFTMEFWAYPTKGIVLVATNGPLANYGQSFAIFPSYGELNAEAGAGVSVGTNGICIVESAPYYLPSVLNYSNSINGWTHVAVVYADKQPALYVNGVYVATGSVSARTFVYPSKDLGGATSAPYNTYGPYEGLLDEVSIYNRALTAAEIMAIYNAGSAGKCFTPTPPLITSQPVSLTNYTGTTAIFSMTAISSGPLSYQWFFGTNSLNQQTNPTLILTNVQLAQSGNYSVTVSNSAGSTNSTIATLTVLPALPCTPPASGLTAWWPGEGNTFDVISGNVGTLNPGVTYAPGFVDQCFSFNGAAGCVINGLPLTNIQNSFTMEFWAYPTKGIVLVATNGPLANYGQSFAIFPSYGELNAEAGAGVSVGTNGICIVESAPYYLPSVLNYSNSINGWTHVAVVYADKQPALYVNGVYVATGSVSARTFVYPSKDLGGATSAPYNTYGPYEGLLDEVSIYNRALTANEIAAIYNAGSGGKCPLPVTITGQPVSQTNVVGTTATFNVTATGMFPLSYQWFFGTNLLNQQTNTTLNLTNVQFSQMGNYSVLVSSYVNSTNSFNAGLTVVFPPPSNATGTAVVSSGFVIGVNITYSGSGYTNTPSIRFIGGGGTGAAGFAVVSNGYITSIVITNTGFGYTNPPVVVIDPAIIYNPVLGIAPMSFLTFSNLTVSGTYQLQKFLGWYWTDQPVSFTASNSVFTAMVAGVANNSSYRLALNPVPTQAFATAQLYNGFVVGITLNSGGSGYLTPPTVSIVGGGGTNATAVTHISGGVVTNISLTSAGIGYANTPTVQIAPPPAAAVFPTVFQMMRVDSASLVPYYNYQIQFRPDLGGQWINWNGGLFAPTDVTNSQFLFVTNGTGFFRLLYVP